MASQPSEILKDRKRLSISTKEYVPRPTKFLCDSSTHFSYVTSFPFGLADSNFKFANIFPRLPAYNDFALIRSKFPPLQDANLPFFELSDYEGYQFVLLLTPNIDDAHKSIKYGVFADDKSVHDQLSEIYANSGGKVVVFLGMEQEKILLGAARLASPFIPDENFNLWKEAPKRDGFFKLKWVFVKHLNLLYTHRFEGGTPLKELPSGTRLSTENGLILLGLMDHVRFKPEKSIFSIFRVLDQREDTFYESRHTVDYEIKLQKRVKQKPSAMADIFSSQSESGRPLFRPRGRKRAARETNWRPSEASIKKLNSDESFTSISEKKQAVDPPEGEDADDPTPKHNCESHKRGPGRPRFCRKRGYHRPIVYVKKDESLTDIQPPEDAPN